MNAKEFISQIEKDYPLKYALEWDNVGLLVGMRDKEIRKVYIALEVTPDVVKAAIEQSVDIIITHHPLIMQPMKRITNECFLTKAIIELLQNDILCYAMHTNYDVLRMGKLASARLGLQNTKPLDIVAKVEKKLETAEVQEEEELGIGEVGDLEVATTLQGVAQIVKEKFQLSEVKIFGELDKNIQKVAIVPGSGKSLITTAVANKADVLITGDIGHHDGLDALVEGLTIIDAGHYGTEYIFIEDMKNYMQKNFADIQVQAHPISPPFCII